MNGIQYGRDLLTRTFWWWCKPCDVHRTHDLLSSCLSEARQHRAASHG